MRLAVRFRRPARSLLLLGVALLILASMPMRPASAISVPKTVDNTLSEFARGTFQRSSLSTIQVPGLNQDVPGAVQLLPVGVLKDWTDIEFDLPNNTKLSNLGAVTIGTHIFVIGGFRVTSTGSAPTAQVWSTNIDPNTGAPTLQTATDYWFAETPMPAVVAADPPFNTPIAGRAAAAVASVATGPDSGYIYVIGGSIQPNQLTTISSYAVSIGTVSGGRITSWAAGPTIPAPPASPFGVVGLQNASAVTFKAGNGKTYVYLLGGLQRFLDAGTAREIGSQQVWYAEVNLGSGALTKPGGGAGSAWTVLAPIPVPNDLDMKGLWDATAVADRIVIPNSSGGENVGDELYIMGGQYQSSVGNDLVIDRYSSAVYRAVIQSAGTIAWQSDTPAPTLPSARVGFSGVQFGGALYMAGGQPPGQTSQAETRVLSTLIEDDFTLAQLGQGSNFQSSDTTLPLPRSRHATVVVRGIPSEQSPNPAYVYVIGGTGRTDDSDNSDDQGSGTVIMGRIGTSKDTETPAFAKEGWYYSAVYDIVISGAQVQEILWSTVITRPADIKLEYRVSTDTNCSEAVQLQTRLFSGVDGSTTDTFFSKNGANQQSLGTPPAARCFQYRVKLSNSTAGLQTSPSLLNVSIRVQVPGFPDLRVLTLKADQDTQQRLQGLNVEIWNHSDRQGEPTQPADAEEPGGSFFVDLFIFGPGETEVAPTIPFSTSPPGDKACVDVPKSIMGVDAVLAITQWYTATDNTCHTVPQDILTFFKKPGKYVVYVAVDTGCPQRPYACVNEGTTGGEGSASNIKRIEFTLPNIPGGPIRYVSRLPILRRAP